MRNPSVHQQRKIMNIDWTNIILGMLTLIGGCGWVIDRKKHRQEVESLKADNRQKNLDLSTDFVEKFRELIAQPLEDEVMKLRTEINQLRDAIEKINDCPHSGHCPVRDELRKQQEDE